MLNKREFLYPRQSNIHHTWLQDHRVELQCHLPLHFQRLL